MMKTSKITTIMGSTQDSVVAVADRGHGRPASAATMTQRLG